MINVKSYGIVLYKVSKKDIKILLCLGVTSGDKWGCLKGSKERDESAYECAKREFFEESSINVGIWLVNASNIDNIDKYFNKDKLKPEYLSWENSDVKFFSISKLPKIKSKQKDLIKDIKDFLKSKNLFH